MSYLIGVFGSAIGWLGSYLAVRWGIKVALIAALFATYTTIWGLIYAAVNAVSSLMPASALPVFVIQFFPDTGAVSIAFSAYFGSMIAKSALEFWKQAAGVASSMGAS